MVLSLCSRSPAAEAYECRSLYSVIPVSPASTRADVLTAALALHSGEQVECGLPPETFATFAALVFLIGRGCRYLLAGGVRLQASWSHVAPHLTRLMEITAPGRSASATIRSLSSTRQRRRRSTPLMTCIPPRIPDLSDALTDARKVKPQHQDGKAIPTGRIRSARGGGPSLLPGQRSCQGNGGCRRTEDYGHGLGDGGAKAERPKRVDAHVGVQGGRPQDQPLVRGQVMIRRQRRYGMRKVRHRHGVRLPCGA